MHARFVLLSVVIGLLPISAADAREIELKPGQPLTAAGIGDAQKVVLRGGTYFMAEPLVLTPVNSKLIIEAHPGEQPILSGGRRIENWREDKFNDRDVFVADVPGVKEGKTFFRQLWINDQRAIRARHPNRGAFFHVKESPDATENWEVGQARFRFDGTDVPAGPFAYGAEAIIGTRWVESRLPIKAVDAEQKLVSFTRKSQWRTEVNDPYFLEGDGRWLDQPGEWFLDRASGRIVYLPRPEEAIEKIVAIAPSPGVSQLIELRGEPAKGKFIEDVTLRGLTFAHTDWMHPDPDPATTQPVSGGFVQAALPLIAAVRGEGLRRVSVENCTFRNLGTWGLELGQSTQLSRVSRCTFRDLGGGGIKLGYMSIGQGNDAQSFGNAIEDCTISDGGKMFMSAVGIWIGQAFDNRIAHNHIHDFYYSGISVGWTWGYEDSLNRGNVIEKNRIHHIGKLSDGDGPLLADMGAIYLLGGRRGSVVRNNVLHDIDGLRFGWGVYLDEGCCDVIVENNLVYRAAHGAFHLHYGRENVVRNNIFAFSRDPQIYRSRQEAHQGFAIARNIIYWTSGSPLTRSSAEKVTFDRNVYGGIAEKDFRVSEMTWPQWRAAGQDKNSIIADPLFVDVAKDDFRLKPDSPAKGVGFEPFDISDVGPRP
ncbi:MAG: hypothetical protein QOE14_1011 [Humisphaera sp.]|nr:hypothetical protein [Humisphaera sp.]